MAQYFFQLESANLVADQLKTLVHHIKANAEINFHRYIVAFCGEPEWCYSQAREAAALFTPSECMWISEHENIANHASEPARAQHYLGREFQAVVFDVYSGFDPDLFAAVSGTIKGGGLLILLCPPLDRWHDFNDPQKSRLTIWPYSASDISGRYLRLIAQAIKQDEQAVVVEQHHPLPQPPTAVLPHNEYEHSIPPIHFPYRSEDQRRAVQAIMHVVSGHRHRPLVITSDRGRGKSAALGIAAAQLLKKGVNKIIVTASRVEAVTPLFACAENVLPDAHRQTGRLSVGKASLVFIPADELVRRHCECNLLMVDEAAAIPASLLKHFITHYARVVFSTTVHGYEGTGRGFALRFYSALNQHTPGWQALQLETPIRWAKHDPLEALVFKSLLLDAQPAADDIVCHAEINNCRFEKLDRQALVDDLNCLSQLFALLVLAHYQTQPADLRYLLDARNLHVYVVRHDDNIIAAALLEEEGGFDAELAAQVYANQRRVRGHLLAQSMATYVGLPQAPLLRYARVMRIAVHPLAQRRGLGGWLLEKIEATLLQGRFDLWGASFGAAADLVRFWKGAGFHPVHLGLGHHAASGAPAAMVLKPLSEKGDQLQTTARHKFERHFVYMLADVYRDVEPALVKALMDTGDNTETLTAEDWRDIDSFVNTARGYEVNSVPVWKLVCAGLRNSDCAAGLSELEYALLVAKVLQKKPWPEVVALGFAGQKQAINALRQAVKTLVNCRTFKQESCK